MKKQKNLTKNTSVRGKSGEKDDKSVKTKTDLTENNDPKFVPINGEVDDIDEFRGYYI